MEKQKMLRVAVCGNLILEDRAYAEGVDITISYSVLGGIYGAGLRTQTPEVENKILTEFRHGPTPFILDKQYTPTYHAREIMLNRWHLSCIIEEIKLVFADYHVVVEYRTAS
jgi:hypothetical protein